MNDAERRIENCGQLEFGMSMTFFDERPYAPISDRQAAAGHNPTPGGNCWSGEFVRRARKIIFKAGFGLLGHANKTPARRGTRAFLKQGNRRKSEMFRTGRWF